MIIRKIIDKLHGKKAVCALLVFALSMTGMAIISRIGDSFMMPHAKIGAIREMILEYPVEIQGVIKAQSAKPMYGIENLKVGEVLVEANQLVAKGDVLFGIDLEDLEDKMQSSERELQKLTLQIEGLENNYESQLNERNRNISRAKEDYSDAENSVNYAIDVAYQNMENARIALENHENQPMDQTGQDSEQDIAAAWEQEHAVLEQNYVQMKQLYDEAVLSGDETMKTASRQMQDADTEIPQDNSADLLKIDVEDLKKFIEELAALKENSGKVNADADGRVSQINISVGSVLGTEPAILLEDSEQAFRFEGGFDSQLSALVTEGEQCGIELTDGSKILENQKITTVSRDEEGDCKVSVDLDLGAVNKSGEAILRFTKTSKLYKKCIPLSALFQGGEGDYVLAVEESVTILGAQITAVKIPVTVLEENGEYAAVEGDFSEHTEIIINANKTIKDGDRIRIVDE